MISMISMISVACDIITAEFFSERLFKLKEQKNKGLLVYRISYIAYRRLSIVDCPLV